MLFGALNQKVVYWGSPVTDGYGKLTFADPIEIDVRWEAKMELFLSFNGKEELSQAIIYSDTEMEIDGYLMLGELTDLIGLTSDPMAQVAACPIKQFKKSPDLTGSTYVRKTWL